ncbi:probable aldehyde oxidase 2 [Oryza glaberrima]|nr:probable aldehyde oxidase 2 [Oryza glaberrima]
MGSEAAAARPVVVTVNGERYEAVGVDPSTTLLEFLRTRTPVRGPKLGCGEGGCGACVVVVSKYDAVADEVTEFSASSCLTLLGSLHHCAVTTSEGIGNSRDGFHAVQRRLSGFHASQCGFCTPGMCMSIYSALARADRCSSRPSPPPGFSKLTAAEAEKAVSGNLCRCTGYRPIVDACKSFAADVDLEDLGLNAFWKKGADDERADVGKLPAYSGGAAVCTFPEFLKSEIRSSMGQANGGAPAVAVTGDGWFHPKSVEEFHRLFDSKLFDERSVKIVASNTGSGVYKDQDLHDKYINISQIPELSAINRSSKGVEIGAVVSISKAIEILSDGGAVFRKIADHLSKVASSFVRNTATIGGNIIMAQRLSFPSDIATVLLAAGSTVTIQVAAKRMCITLEEFLKQPPCDSRTLLVSISIPDWGSDDGITFESFRAAPRPLGNAVSYVNSAFLARSSVDGSSGSHLIEDVCLAFGAFGAEHAIRAREVEEFLKGKLVSAPVILEAVRLLKGVVSPAEGTTHPEYRVSLAVSYLFRFLTSLANGLDEPENANVPNGSCTNGTANGSANSSPEKHSNVDSSDLPIKSRQEMVFSDEYKPVGKPIEKTGAELQASGEAVYVDDIPAPKDCLYGAFIYSTHPHAHIKDINFRSSLASQKVITVITAKDIPTGGENIGSCFPMLGDEALFVDPVSEFAGQNIGVVIAETQKYAYMAAKQAVIEYSTENLQPPILTIEDAVQHNSYFPVPPFLAPTPIGDFNQAMSEADHKIIDGEVKLESQYYFYMETQTALAIPDEDNCITLYVSAQLPELTQNIVARCLGIPYHNVRIITRRVGGGFGGKAMKTMHVAAACAVAAFKLRRPVRMYLDRKTDMIMAGGRHPMKVKYSVGFKSDGKITGLHFDLGMNGGISPDCSPVLPVAIVGALKKYNWGALSFDIKVCKTNVSSKSAMRAPGDAQGSFIAEAIVEHIASTLSVDTNAIRRKNLHDFESLKVFYGNSAGDPSTYSLVTIFDKLASSPEYQQRAAMVEHFNAGNRWKKRGISCVPITYDVRLRPTPGKVSIMNDGSIAVEVGGVEIGQGLWTKVKQMTAFALGQLCDDGGEGLIDKVRVIQADTLSMIQGGFTGGSTTSETSCEAVRKSCAALVERLKPIKEKAGTLPWKSLIAQASMASVKLTEHAYWTPDPTFTSYLNYGAAISEVEVDVLTGETTILRSDLVYDCGQSLNPAVDLGQVEGAFVQGIGFFTNEEYATNSDGLVIHDSTWTYKIPTVDTIPKQFNVELINSARDHKRVLSSKASGEPPLLLASSVHCAMREAIRAARKEFAGAGGSPLTFQMDVPATMPIVKELCGLDVVERYLESFAAKA